MTNLEETTLFGEENPFDKLGLGLSEERERWFGYSQSYQL